MHRLMLCTSGYLCFLCFHLWNLCLHNNIIYVSGLLHIDEWQKFSMGYKEFMHELFDENVLFLEGKIVAMSLLKYLLQQPEFCICRRCMARYAKNPGRHVQP